VVLIGNTARDIEHQGERVLGHRVIAATYDIGDGNAASGGFRDIEVLHSGAGDADHAQLWASVDDCGGEFRKSRSKGKNDVGIAYACDQVIRVVDMAVEDLHVRNSPQPVCLGRASVGAGDVVRNYDFHADARPIPRSDSKVDAQSRGPAHRERQLGHSIGIKIFDAREISKKNLFFDLVLPSIPLASE
jgi:hypothetical protein